MLSASFILDASQDGFMQWVYGALLPLIHSREISLAETLSPVVAALRWTTDDEAPLWGIETYKLGPERTEVMAWLDPCIARPELSLWPLVLALDVIFTRFPEACPTLEWQPNDNSEMGAIFTGAMQRLRAGKAGVKEKDATVPGDKASEIAARRHTVLDRWEQRAAGTTQEKFKRDTANYLAVSESTIRDDLAYWKDRGDIK
jgi:hypothetical protein